MTAAVLQSRARYGFYGLAVLFAALAVIGGIRSYSPAPFWDMWISYLPFLDQASSGGWEVWWKQHNEHRIVLARLFFWMDLRWFDGAGWFLIVVNYALVTLGAVLYCRILREAVVGRGRELERHALTALLVIWLFSWTQWGNLTWGFQSQFFLAQLLPLAALYLLYRSIQDGAGIFALACLLGVMSAGTMANGILALPLMTVYAALTRQRAARIGALALLTALTLFAYFYDYSAVVGHGSLSQALREQPLRLAVYMLYYLGNPFYEVLGGRAPGRIVVLSASLFMVLSTLRFAWQLLRQPRPPALPLALLFFIVYIIGTAFGTAGGRLIFGYAQALGTRYATPGLMAWAALLVLYAPALLALGEQARRWVWTGLALLVLAMLVYQVKALRSQADELFARSIGALAIEMRIADKAAIGKTYPDTGPVVFTQEASDKQRSFFGLYPYRGARAQMGHVFAPAALPVCQGALEEISQVEGDYLYLRVRGWLAQPGAQMAPPVVRFLDAGGKQVGYALGGEPRAEAGQGAGFRGYLAPAAQGELLTVRGEGPDGPVCQLQLKTKAPPAFIVKAEAPSAQGATVGRANVIDASEWAGTDYFKSELPGMQVYGSYVASDADRGTIALRLKRGDRLFYRSGPSMAQQTMLIDGVKTVPLPLAKDWVLLEFAGDELPAQAFTVKLSDNGSGWGEWSAIALKSH